MIIDLKVDRNFLVMIPALTRAGIIEVDRIMTEELSIPVELMMEHASLSLAHLTVKYLNHKFDDIIFVIGKGNNGGGGLVAARRLQNWGYGPKIWVPHGNPEREIVARQYERAINCGVTKIDNISFSLKSQILVVDSYIGYNFIGEIREVDYSSKILA